MDSALKEKLRVQLVRGGMAEEAPCSQLLCGEQAVKRARTEARAGEQVRGDDGLVRVVALELQRSGENSRTL